MTEPTELRRLMENWKTTFDGMVADGANAYDCADSMLTFSGMMLEKIIGSPAASLALRAGSDFLQQRGKPPAPTDDSGAVH